MWHVTDPRMTFPDLHEVSHQHRSLFPCNELHRDVVDSSGLLTHIAGFFQQFSKWLKHIRNVLLLGRDVRVSRRTLAGVFLPSVPVRILLEPLHEVGFGSARPLLRVGYWLLSTYLLVIQLLNRLLK